MGKHKNFIKKAYNGELGLTMCQEWKNKILEKYPEFEVVRKEKTWYIGGDYLFFLNKIDNERINFRYRGWGFSSGVWKSNIGFNHCGNCFERKATKEEVTECLIAEGKKRFGEVIEHKTYFKTVDDKILFINNTFSRSWDYCEYLEAEDELKYLGFTLYRKGKWAEKTYTIITKSEAEQKLNELGVNVKIVD